MPCHDSRDRGHSIEYRDSPQQQQKIDRLTALLCYACKLIESGGSIGEPVVIGSELQSWWLAHKAADQRQAEAHERQKQEATKAKQKKEHLASIRRRLMTQLTVEEKQALGVNLN